MTQTIDHKADQCLNYIQKKREVGKPACRTKLGSSIQLKCSCEYVSNPQRLGMHQSQDEAKVCYMTMGIPKKKRKSG